MDQSAIDEAIGETIVLTEALRDYIQSRRNVPRGEGDPMANLAIVQQTSRMTGLLTNVLSWLMWCKAEAAGEIKSAELPAKLDELKDAIPETGDLSILPEDLSALVLRGRELLARTLAFAESAG